MQRGDVFLVSLDTRPGVEDCTTSPAVLVSNDAANATASRTRAGVVAVVPITSNTSRVYPFQVRLGDGEAGLERRSKAQAEQVRSIEVTRLGRRLGALRPGTLRRLDEALRLHLAL